MSPDELRTILRFKLKVCSIIGEILENDDFENFPEHMAAEILVLSACVFVDSGFSEEKFIAMARTSWTLAFNGNKN
jgi:hypothetical protein